jgi:lysophospholipase L1-like esterase
MPRRVVFALVVLFAALAVAEGVLALTGDAVGPVFALKKGIRWTMQAGLRRHPIEMAAAGRAFRVTTNADGLRGDSAPGAAGGKSTVLMLGDSTIFGWGVDDGEDVPTALERALRARGASVRVVNGGQPGFSTVQSWMLLREVGVRYEPDLVVLEFALHDFRRAPRPDSRAIDASGSSRADYWLAAHSRVYRALRQLVVLGSVAPTGEEFRGGEIVGVGEADPRSDEVRVPPDDFTSALRGMAALGRAEGFRVALAWPPRDTDRLPERYVAAAEALAAAGEIAVVDYSGAWKAEGGGTPADWLADDPGHYSPAGAAIAGRALAERLVGMGLIE